MTFSLVEPLRHFEETRLELSLLHLPLLITRCSIARHKNDPTAKYCQLGTAAIGGGGSVRTWVFRGFYEDKGALKFITDRRSQKIPEIAADPGACVGSEGLLRNDMQERRRSCAWFVYFFAHADIVACPRSSCVYRPKLEGKRCQLLSLPLQSNHSSTFL